MFIKTDPVRPGPLSVDEVPLEERLSLAPPTLRHTLTETVRCLRYALHPHVASFGSPTTDQCTELLLPTLRVAARGRWRREAGEVVASASAGPTSVVCKEDLAVARKVLAARRRTIDPKRLPWAPSAAYMETLAAAGRLPEQLEDALSSLPSS